MHRGVVDADDFVRASDAEVAEVAAVFGQRVSTLDGHSRFAAGRLRARGRPLRHRPLHRPPSLSPRLSFACHIAKRNRA